MVLSGQGSLASERGLKTNKALLWPSWGRDETLRFWLLQRPGVLVGSWAMFFWLLYLNTLHEREEPCPWAGVLSKFLSSLPQASFRVSGKFSFLVS